MRGYDGVKVYLNVAIAFWDVLEDEEGGFGLSNEPKIEPNGLAHVAAGLTKGLNRFCAKIFSQAYRYENAGIGLCDVLEFCRA